MTLSVKRFNGRKVAPKDKNWDRATWVVEFELRGHRIHEAIPEARNKRQAEQAETNIKQSIFDRKYNKASGTVRFVDFIDNEYLPWARENKRSYRDDEQRAVRVKEFFGNRLIRDIAQPLLVEKFKSNLRKSESKWSAPSRPRPSTAISRSSPAYSRWPAGTALSKATRSPK